MKDIAINEETCKNSLSEFAPDVVLADFGLAKGNQASTLKTYCGTPAYMAPEMIDSDRLPYNPKVDMWSLGVVLFTGICGYPPFSDDYTDMDLKSQIKTGKVLSYEPVGSLTDWLAG
ncbi:hypothetical protein COOONC_25389 [Cooperia oncophora]